MIIGDDKIPDDRMIWGRVKISDGFEFTGSVLQLATNQDKAQKLEGKLFTLQASRPILLVVWRVLQASEGGHRAPQSYSSHRRVQCDLRYRFSCSH